jgi:hypothetical protein
LRRDIRDTATCIYLLLEFQSRPDAHMALRMMGYAALLLQEHARTIPLGAKLPPVLAVVLYNGRSAWRAPLALQEMADICPSGLRTHQPQLRYLLLDQAHQACSGPIHAGNPVALLFRLEQSRHPTDIAKILADLARCTHPARDASLRRAFVEWLRNSLLPGRFPDLKISVIDDLEEFRNMLADTVKDWTRQWKQEGMQAGRREGKHTATRTLLTRLLTRRYGPVPAAISRRIAQAPLQDLERWSLTLLDAPDIGSVFADTQPGHAKEKAAEAALPPGTPAS